MYLEPLVYMAPVSCPTPFTFSTMVVLSEVTNLVTPTSITTTVDSLGDQFTQVTAYLPPNAVPTTDFLFSTDITSCQIPARMSAAFCHRCSY